MSVTLIAYPLNDSNVEVPYALDTMGGTDIAVTYSIGDIEDVTKQRGSFSKTITLPNTPTNRACFAYAYNIQSFVGGFQPNKRIRAAMWEDGVQVFSGVGIEGPNKPRSPAGVYISIHLGDVTKGMLKGHIEFREQAGPLEIPEAGGEAWARRKDIIDGDFLEEGWIGIADKGGMLINPGEDRAPSA